MKQHSQQQQQQGANRDQSMNNRSTDQGDVTKNLDAQQQLDRSASDEDMPM